MQKLNTLWQVVNAASTVRDFAQHTKTYYFGVNGPATFYLQAENTDVRIMRWPRPQIEVTVKLQGAFGWRIATDQDEAGVYVAAARRMVVGSVSSAQFEIVVPHETYLAFNLSNSSLRLDHINGTLTVDPPGETHTTRLQLGAGEQSSSKP